MRRSRATPAFVCPRCRGPLSHLRDPDAERYRCDPCAADYPVVLGIPDFRLEPDPWIAIVDDHAKGRRLAERAQGQTFAEMVRTYWDMTRDTPRALADHFIDHVVTAEPRAEEWLDALDVRDAGAPPDGPWLDVGCGTADIVVAAARRGQVVVGVDLAFRWLVAARRRLEEAGVEGLLVCANGEHLPFADGTFARVVALGTLEHCRDAEALVGQARRVLRARGSLHLRTTNRFSLLREPHVGVWGVGFVPRRWADAYVRWRSGQRYLHHRPLSRRELRRGLRRAGFAHVRVEPSALLASDRRRLGRAARAAGWYQALRQLPPTRAALSWIAPLLDARGVAP